MKPNTKAIILDWGGVIVTDGFKRAVPALSKRLGVSDEDLYRAYIKTINPNYVRGLIKIEDRWNALFDALGVRYPLKDFLAEYYKIFQPIKGTIELVQKLKQAGYKVGVLSNQSEETLKFLREKYPTLFKLFDFYLWSCELGYAKPDPRIFEKALEMAGTPADQCVYIDDQDKFLEKAKSLGFHTLKFQSPEQLKQALILGKLLKEDPPERNRETLKNNYNFVKKA